MLPNFDEQVQAWSSPPVESLNAYVPSSQLLAMPDEELRLLVAASEKERYEGWRNDRGLWREALGLDSTHGQRVLDFGCGVGLEALQFAKSGNIVSVADIAPTNVALARRVLQIHGYEPLHSLMVEGEFPFIYEHHLHTFDVFYCAGVLHHIWYPQDIIRMASEMLAPGGEVRLMLYTDQAWRNYVGTEPPIRTASDPGFWTFVRAFDQVGSYADWYDAAKIKAWFGKWFILEEWVYLTPWNNYAAAILKRR